jgi:hypothetical protein
VPEMAIFPYGYEVFWLSLLGIFLLICAATTNLKTKPVYMSLSQQTKSGDRYTEKERIVNLSFYL